MAASELAAIVRSSADAIIGKTLDGIITSWNTGAERQYGYAADEAIGHSVSLIFPPDHAEELPWILDRVRHGEMVDHLQTKRRCKDGTILDVSISVSPVLSRDGTVTGAATVGRDISDRVRLEAERLVSERRRQRSERLESLGQLAGGVAHDFNNLLAIILNYAAFVAEETADDPAVQADLAHIQDAAERAARIASQLLIVGRQDTATPEALALNAVIADTRELLSAAIGASIQIRLRTAQCLPDIKADRGQIEQVLINLAVNARDAMPQGGTLTIETGIAELTEHQARTHAGVKPGRYVRLVVSDIGKGMSADVQEHLFEPFFTTKPTGHGTGLGLATVHGIVSRAAGSITVESAEGMGTTFRILLPIAAQAPATPPASAAPEQGTGQTILVVDDEPSVLQLTARILRQNGYATLEAGTYEEALIMASSEKFQLLLTDCVMPRMSGPTLADNITSMKPGTPVMYMSGHSTELLHGSTSANLAGYLQKPFTPNSLLKKVHSILGPASNSSD